MKKANIYIYSNIDIQKSSDSFEKLTIENEIYLLKYFLIITIGNAFNLFKFSFEILAVEEIRN